jgi:hypothetical protein
VDDAKKEGRSLRRFGNLLRESHRTARSVPLLYPLLFPYVTVILLPLFIVEPEGFEYPDHS